MSRCDLEENEQDLLEYQCHGDHWLCILENPEEQFSEILSTSVENASVICGDVETDYNIDGKTHGRVIEVEYSKKDDSIAIRIIFCPIDDSIQLISVYPCVKKGVQLSLKIAGITEWENGLEAWISAELPDERELTFFDSNYAINKDKYEVGKTYNFMIGALAYLADEPEQKGFFIEGQKAVDFRTRLGQELEYDENGKVKPIEISTESLCAFMQVCASPDDVEFISTVEKFETVDSFDDSFWKFHVINRSMDDEECDKIPTYIKKTEKNQNLDKATQLQGVLWLSGYLVEE